MRFSLLTARAVAGAPFCVGFAFRRGDIPAEADVVSEQVPALQVTPLNRWPDGSLKFALLAGQVDLAGGVGRGVTLRRAAKQTRTGASLGTADLRKGGLTAEVSCGSHGHVTWSGADWDMPWRSWISGPMMSSWIYRKPVGRDAHLVAWLELRLFANGEVDVLPWIENGHVAVPDPGNRSATYRFVLSGIERFRGAIDLKHHQRTPLLDGTHLSHRLGGDPDLSVQHDALYLMSTELVPSYLTRAGATTDIVSLLPATFTPLQAGSFNYDGDSMASPGYQDPIGLLPQHDVLYLVAEDPAVHAAVVRNGYSAGRWGIHYRDETTQRPLRFSLHRTRVIADGQGFKDNGDSTTGNRTPVATGGQPPGWDVAHSPSVGYLAYLVTARWYFMEQVQFATTANYLGNGDNDALRAGSAGLVQTAVGAWQTRSCAWDWRARVQALTVTPDDDDDLRDEFIRSVEANIAHFHGRYVAQPNNPFGWILPGESYSDVLDEGASWQQDFVTAAFGWSVSMDMPISASAKARLAAFFQWKAHSVVMRLGDAQNFWYVHAAPYTMRIGRDLNVASYTEGRGPWLADDAAVYRATYASPPAWLSHRDGVLASEYDTAFWARSMWGNLQPALAYAVRHGVPGALAGHARMVQASNWTAVRTALEARPVWAVCPPTLTPSWLEGKPLHTWFEIPGTRGAGGSSVGAFGGMAMRGDTSEIWIAAAGGHLDSADNRVVSINLAADQPRWVQRHAPSTDVQMDVSHYRDGKPAARHTYQTTHWVPTIGRVMLMGARYTYGNAHQFPTVDGYEPASETWDASATHADLPAGFGHGVVVDGQGHVWTHTLRRWNPASGVWSDPITSKNGAPFVRWPWAFDTRRQQIFGLCFGDGEGFGDKVINAVRVPVDGATAHAVSFNPSPALAQFIADEPAYAGMDHDPVHDRFFFYAGQGASAGRLYVIVPTDGNVWDMAVLPLAPGSATPPDPGPAGLHNRLRYVPALRGFVLMARASDELLFIRTS